MLYDTNTYRNSSNNESECCSGACNWNNETHYDTRYYCITCMYQIEPDKYRILRYHSRQLTRVVCLLSACFHFFQAYQQRLCPLLATNPCSITAPAPDVFTIVCFLQI